MAGPLKAIIEQMEADIEDHYAGTDYMECYVAFLDIMGMKNLVERPYLDMRRIFNAAESAKKLYGSIGVPDGTRFISEDHLQMTIMSDSIVLSIPTTIDNSFSKIVGFSSYLIQKLISQVGCARFLCPRACSIIAAWAYTACPPYRSNPALVGVQYLCRPALTVPKQ